MVLALATLTCFSENINFRDVPIVLAFIIGLVIEINLRCALMKSGQEMIALLKLRCGDDPHALCGNRSLYHRQDFPHGVA